MLNNLFVDIILEQQFLKQHEHVQKNFQGTKPPLHLVAFMSIKTDLTPRVFENLDADCKLVVTKLRWQSKNK